MSQSAEPSDVQAARELLLQEFGEKGLDYLIIGTYGEKVVAEIPTNASVNASAVGGRYLSVAGDDGVYQYYIGGWGMWATFPWGSHAWANTDEQKVVKSTGAGVNCQCGTTRSMITDSVTPTPNSYTEANHTFDIFPFDTYVTAFGNYVSGFFPGPPTNVTTYHDLWDGVLTNGHASLVLHWN